MTCPWQLFLVQANLLVERLAWLAIEQVSLSRMICQFFWRLSIQYITLWELNYKLQLYEITHGHAPPPPIAAVFENIRAWCGFVGKYWALIICVQESCMRRVQLHLTCFKFYCCQALILCCFSCCLWCWFLPVCPVYLSIRVYYIPVLIVVQLLTVLFLNILYINIVDFRVINL